MAKVLHCEGIGYRLEPPDKPGWWLWIEGGRDEPVRLLIVCGSNHCEVAADDDVAQAMGLDEPPEDFNYWEMTDCKTMPGLWKFDGAAAPHPLPDPQERGRG